MVTLNSARWCHWLDMLERSALSQVEPVSRSSEEDKPPLTRSLNNYITFQYLAVSSGYWEIYSKTDILWGLIWKIPWCNRYSSPFPPCGNPKQFPEICLHTGTAGQITNVWASKTVSMPQDVYPETTWPRGHMAEVSGCILIMWPPHDHLLSLHRCT